MAYYPHRSIVPLVQAVIKAAEQLHSPGALQPVVDQLLQLDSVAQLGYNPSQTFHTRLPSDQISYLPIGRDPGRWSLGCFVFAPFAKMPLHDHPGMHGFARIIEGSLCVSTYDWAQGSTEGQAGGQATMKSVDEWLHAPALTCVHPSEGNLHELSAGANGCVMLDALLPDYDDEHGRPCSFYMPRDAHLSEHNGRYTTPQRDDTNARQGETITLVDASDLMEDEVIAESAFPGGCTPIQMEEWPPCDAMENA
jgi:hypothetical protein